MPPPETDKVGRASSVSGSTADGNEDNQTTALLLGSLCCIGGGESGMIFGKGNYRTLFSVALFSI